MRLQFLVPLLLLSLSHPSSKPAYSAARAESVETFVCRQYIHGMPYSEAHSLGAKAIPILSALIEDPSRKQCWANAIAVVAVIGSPESYEILRRFMWERFRGEVDEPTYDALESAVATMGFASLGQPSLVAAYLESGADPKHWSRLPWHYPTVGRERTQRAFSLFSIHSLGFCSNPRARSALLRLKDKPYAPGQEANIRASLRTNEEVTRVGLRAYQESKRSK